MGQKYFTKKNYKVIIIRFLLHQNIISKILLIDVILNIEYLLKLQIPIYIIFFFIKKIKV